jgi:hypothetical protein
MAAMSSKDEPARLNPQFSDPSKRGIPSRNPLPLSATQEGEVKQIYYKNVRAKCAEEIQSTEPSKRSRPAYFGD